MDQSKLEELQREHPAIEKEIAEHGAKHPEIAVVATACGPAIFRRPSRTEYKRHLGMIFDEKQRASAAEFLARQCVVHPSRETFDSWLEEKPGIPLACADVLSELAGTAKKEDEKK